MKHKDVWNGEHRSVRYEVVRWSTGESDVWNYYLFLPEKQIPEGWRDRFILKPQPPTKWGRVFYPYGEKLPGLEFHGGCTFYEKLGGLDGNPITVQIGCDYNHAWDQDGYFTDEIVGQDARRSIDVLWETVPDLLVRCSYNGRFFPASDGEFAEDGTFTSHEGKKESDRHRAEYAKENPCPTG